MKLTRIAHTVVCFALICSTNTLFAEPLRVVSYNVENLFHPANDSITDDEEWTPEGMRRWSYTRYYKKEENIARVLTSIGEWDGVDVVGLQEVENALCVKRLCYTLRRGEYDLVHYDSPDRRGIDVAFVYKKARVDTIRTRAIEVDLKTETTRDILYVCAQIDKRDTIHFFVCHMPSQRGGRAESEWKRVIAKEVLQESVDSILTIEPEAKIIVMGDMNSEPLEDLKGLANRMSGLELSGLVGGTHKYQGQWTCLDQFYLSSPLDNNSKVWIFEADWLLESDDKYLGLKPKRTYNGYRYRNGYSDHLPIVLECRR